MEAVRDKVMAALREMQAVHGGQKRRREALAVLWADVMDEGALNGGVGGGGVDKGSSRGGGGSTSVVHDKGRRRGHAVASTLIMMAGAVVG